MLRGSKPDSKGLSHQKMTPIDLHACQLARGLKEQGVTEGYPTPGFLKEDLGAAYREVDVIVTHE